MTTSKTAISRPPSARSTSVARTIAKRRDKPYKTEQNRMFAKKRKLNLQTTYRSSLPEGFQFLPVGTPDLAERCKEISRQRGLPVHVVNAKPVSKHAVDPGKVSHHIHRIGYNFRSEVVEDACQELGYFPSRGMFVKEADLAQLNEQSRMARTLAKHGLVMDQSSQLETDDQVRAAIKELFPRIPEEDLKAILQHAWEEGSHRVGTNNTIELPRRVQLAVIARIRHTYTDYDRLLKAFEWKEARSLVEPTCLQKLIEWRGETDEDDSNELEEVVRETIVIDDDDQGPIRHASEADDEESPGAMETGYNSDTSIEISHRLAADEDLGAESHDERSKQFLQRYQPRPRNVQERYLDVRQKIGAARERIRNGVVPVVQPEIVRVHVPEASNGFIEIGGQQYRRMPPSLEIQRPPSQHMVPQPTPQGGAYATQPFSPVSPQQYRQVNPLDGYATHDRPIASIEPQDGLRRLAMTSASAQKTESKHSGNRSRPVTPDSEPFDKRRRLDYPTPTTTTASEYYQSQRGSPAETRYRPVERYGQPRETFQLTSVESSSQRYQASPRGAQFADHQPANGAYSRPPVQGATQSTSARSSFGQGPEDVVPYDPQQPLLRFEDYRDHNRGGVPHQEHDHRPGFVDAQVAPIQYIPRPQQQSGHHNPASHYPPPPHDYQNWHPGYAQPQVIYVQSQAPRASYTPQPVHGAPAAVQQVPREPQPHQPQPAGSGYQPTAPAVQQHPQYYGGQPQQPQYYYPR